LAAAHAAGITHRDIKPANLIVTPSGAVKICDFGVARLLDRSGDANLTGPALAWGSPNYMAPEQINAGPIDRRTDLYALGCTLYAMLTGAPPFDGDATLGVLHQHLTTQPESLRLRRVEAPSQVEELVRDLLAKSPGERPPDALAVRDRIAAARADLAPAGTRPVPDRSASGSAGATRRHNRRIVAAFAAACLALAAAIVVPILLTKSDPVAGSGTALTSAATSPAAALNPPTSIPSSSGSPSALSSSTRTRAAHSATPSRPPVRIDPVTALRQAISAQVTAGNLDAGAAPGLNHMVDDLANAIDTGNTGDVTNKIKALRAKLANLYKGHQLNDVGYRALNAAVDQVAADQPQPSSTPKPSPPPPPSPRP
jgi:serine/threonine-protein kinase